MFIVTPKQKKVLDFVKSYIKNKGYSPSYREIGKALGLKSSSTVHAYIQQLKQGGYLSALSLPRSVVPYDLNLDEALRIPLVGSVSAGVPLEVYEYKEHIVIPKKLVAHQGGKLFALRVVGDSMVDEGIFDGDYIICEKGVPVNNGDNVVAYLCDTNEVLLKKFFKRRGYIELVPRNKNLKSIKVKNVEIQGVVKAVIRKYA